MLERLHVPLVGAEGVFLAHGPVPDPRNNVWRSGTLRPRYQQQFATSTPTPARSAQHCNCTARCAKVRCSAVTHGSHPARVRCLLTHASQPTQNRAALESNAYNPPESERSRKTNHMHKQRIGAYIAKARAKGPGVPHVPPSRSTLLRALSIDLSSQSPETRRRTCQ